MREDVTKLTKEEKNSRYSAAFSYFIPLLMFAWTAKDDDFVQMHYQKGKKLCKWKALLILFGLIEKKVLPEAAGYICSIPVFLAIVILETICFIRIWKACNGKL